jgi:hypothetical protein
VGYPDPMPTKKLHIVDGESTGGNLRVSGLAKGKDILRWKDALYTGPVPAGLSLEKLSTLRSKFWTAGKRKNVFQKRDAQLLTWREYDEIVLWLGSTSICQLSLAQILAWFGQQKLGQRRISLIAAYRGVLRPEQLIAPYEARKTVTAEQVQLATRFWKAFTSSTPEALQRLLKANLLPWPEVGDTNELHQEYPSRYDGLSRLGAQVAARNCRNGDGDCGFCRRLGNPARLGWGHSAIRYAASILSPHRIRC